MTATYDESLQCWRIEWAGLAFHVTGIPFDRAAFDWARESAQVVRNLDPEFRARVMECLQGWPCDKSTAEVLYVDLDDYAQSGTIDVAFAGDDSWGDFGVNVIIKDGRIVDAYGGD